ncbi:hypothetical protein [Butyrivibrio sp. AE3006]|uniref:hypothetical protein n=1 Tax=Butyrivibrio sp. AE3006 TaxID=1280673 RepID=UPI000408E9CE|nr:hypothetical protein [Butyrivibrio sp. AE3006]
MPDMESKEYALTCCKFAPRCPYATDECRQNKPDEVAIEGGRSVYCFHPLKAAMDRQQELLSEKK